jgi:hypothetical protein
MPRPVYPPPPTPKENVVPTEQEAIWSSEPVRTCWRREKSLSTGRIRTARRPIYYTDYAIAAATIMENNVSFLANSANSPNCSKLIIMLSQTRESLEDFSLQSGIGTNFPLSTFVFLTVIVRSKHDPHLSRKTKPTKGCRADMMMMMIIIIIIIIMTTIMMILICHKT